MHYLDNKVFDIIDARCNREVNREVYLSIYPHNKRNRRIDIISEEFTLKLTLYIRKKVTETSNGTQI